MDPVCEVTPRWKRLRSFGLDRILAVVCLTVLSPTLLLMPFALIAAASSPVRLAACLVDVEALALAYAGQTNLLMGATVELLAALWIIGYFAFILGCVVIVVTGPGKSSTVIWAATFAYCLVILLAQPWSLPVWGTRGFSPFLGRVFVTMTALILASSLAALARSLWRCRLIWPSDVQALLRAVCGSRWTSLGSVALLIAALVLGAFYWRVHSLPPVLVTEQVVVWPSSRGTLDEPDGRFRVAVKVRNVSNSVVIFPTFGMLGDGAPAGRIVTTLCLEPDEIAYLDLRGEVNGVFTIPQHVEVSYGGRDQRVPEEYGRKQAALRRQVRFIDTTVQRENGRATLRTRLENDSGVQLDLVEATAVFLDDNGQLIDVADFLYDPKVAGEEGVWSVPLELDAARAGRHFVQINHIRPRGAVLPGAVPPVPSVR